MALSAISFVNRAKDDTRFDISIDNDGWTYLTKDEAITILVSYECEQTKIGHENGLIDDEDLWCAEVMEWQIDWNETNMIRMVVC